MVLSHYKQNKKGDGWNTAPLVTFGMWPLCNTIIFLRVDSLNGAAKPFLGMLKQLSL